MSSDAARTEPVTQLDCGVVLSVVPPPPGIAPRPHLSLVLSDDDAAAAAAAADIASPVAVAPAVAAGATSPLPDAAAAVEAFALSPAEAAPPPLDVVFRDLTVVHRGAGARTPEAAAPSMALTRLACAAGGALRRALCGGGGGGGSAAAAAAAVRDLHALHGLTGTLRAGSSTLVLGSAGCGKSTLLRVLSGREAASSGEVLFNGEPAAALRAKGLLWARLAAHCPQEDEHEPLLTVRATLGYVNALAGGADSRVEALLRQLGLAHVADTLLGDEAVRGISGGQKRRVSVGEALLPGAPLLCLDEPTNGLDAATAFDLMGGIVAGARASRGVLLAALQAPTPETFALFDEVLLLADGCTLFHGSRHALAPYLASLGLPQPAAEELPVWAVQVATAPALALERVRAAAAGRSHHQRHEPGQQQQQQLDKREHHQHALDSTPRLIAHWAAHGAAWLDAWRAARQLPPPPPPLAGGFVLAGAAAARRFGVAPVLPLRALLAATLHRECAIVLADWRGISQRFARINIIALIVGSLFFQTPASDIVSRVALAAYTGITTGMAHGALTIKPIVARRVVWARHVESRLYPGSALALASFVAMLPLSLVLVFSFGSIVYWMTGFAADQGRWWFFLLCLWAADLCFRTFALWLGIAIPALAALVGDLAGSLLYLVAGYVISLAALPRVVLPLFYLSPYSWLLRSMVINEFSAPAYAAPYLPPAGAPIAGYSIAQAAYDTFGFTVSPAWQWGGVAYLAGLTLLFLGLAARAAGAIAPRLRPGTRRLLAFSVVEGEEEEGGGGSGVSGGGEGDAPPTKPAAVVADASAAVTLAHRLARRAHAASAAAHPSHVEAPHHEVVRAQARPRALHAEEEAAFQAAHAKGEAVHLFEAPAGGGGEGEPLPPTALVEFTYEDVCYSVPDPKHPRGPPLQLLHGITGVCRPRTMTALMGASGAGKTTLLDVLANRKTTGRASGSVRLNGRPVSREVFARSSGYCEQVDLHLPEQTVGEAVEMSAALRAGLRAAHEPHEAAAARLRAGVTAVLRMLDMEALEQRAVATLSPGETKRLTIAVELASNPSVLFLDEPTSGLDALSAAVVVRALRRIADSGRTIICTIHQPSADVFFAFDQLMLLAPGGHTVYAGPTGAEAATLVRYLEALTPAMPRLAPGVCPANYMLDCFNAPGVQAALAAAAGSAAGAAAAAAGEAPPAAVLFARSAEGAANLANVAAAAAAAADKAPVYHARAGADAQFYYVLRRTYNEFGRAGDLLPMMLVGNIIFALYFGVLWYQLDLSQLSGVQSMIGFISTSQIFFGLNMCTFTLDKLNDIRAILYREEAAHEYSTFAYSLALDVFALPRQVAFALIFVSISYFMAGLKADAATFFIYVLGVVAFSEYLEKLLELNSALAPTRDADALLNSFSNTIVQLFSGLFIPGSRMGGWKFMYYIVGSSWALKFTTLPQLVGEAPVAVPGVPFPVPTSYFAGAIFDAGQGDVWPSFGYLVLITMVLRILGALALRLINYTRR